MADGDPEGVRIVDRMNWTGVGVVFPRERWASARLRPELARTGVYVLVGYKEGDEDLPTLMHPLIPLHRHIGKKNPADGLELAKGLRRARLTFAL